MLSARRGTLAAARTLQLARRARGLQSQVPAAPPPPDPQLGDYPNLPLVYSYQRNPYGNEAGPWWDRQNRRHFGEPIPAEDEALSVWSPDVPHVPPRRALFHFSIAVVCFLGYGLLVPALAVEAPVARRSYPHDGLVKELGGLEANKARSESVDDDE
ncbi:hypothetical protein AURDEDRAFT_99049 [Auricularia subglabra TFB-10046 SS5]|nr:hypothetical protein AURDEDRAFT_99049 [Auricularia subglabra TFB-10046 SS5]